MLREPAQDKQYSWSYMWICTDTFWCHCHLCWEEANNRFAHLQECLSFPSCFPCSHLTDKRLETSLQLLQDKLSEGEWLLQSLRTSAELQMRASLALLQTAASSRQNRWHKWCLHRATAFAADSVKKNKRYSPTSLKIYFHLWTA